MKDTNNIEKNLKCSDNKCSKYVNVIILIVIIFFQTAIYIKCGFKKSYIHMDEAYSLGLASYDKVEIQDNEDFYNEWHDGKYYEDYLTVNDDEVGKYSQVYENQKNDVHPPLYYLILRFAMGFHLNNFSKWPGMIVNIIIYAAITVFTYLISKILLKNQNKLEIKALLIAFVSSLTFSSITNVLYIRMYALSTLNIVVTTYLHLRLLESEKYNRKMLFAIGCSAFIGSLTHYYYLFYLAALALMMVINYIENRAHGELVGYLVTLGIAGICSILVFPYSIKHMFFGYRGQGAINNLSNISNSIGRIFQYLNTLNKNAFNGTLYIIIIISVAIIVYKKIKKIKIFNLQSDKTKFIVIPAIFYFVLVSVSSPWIELRYILPICGIIFSLVIVEIFVLTENFLKKDVEIRAVLIMCLVILIMPVLRNQISRAVSPDKTLLEPEETFSDKHEIVEKLSNELNVPTLYAFSSNCNRFLDDILLFSSVDESYVAKDIEYNEENIKNIMAGKDLSNGIVIFINEGNDNDQILTALKETLNLGGTEYLKRLNACDVYYMK